MKIPSLFILIFASLQILQAQNLIQDSSFEYNKFIPIEYSSIGSSGSWSSPSRATTDLFCKCKKKKKQKQKQTSPVDVPQNAMGYQEARSGNCYAGIFACSHGYYREYLQTPLNSSLEKGKEYILTMYVSLSDYSRLAIDKIGVCFLNNKVRYEHSDVITNVRPIYIPLEEEVGMDINDWHQLTLIFKANGGENNLLIGSFVIRRLWQTGNTVPSEISSPINKRIERDAYYYFDDISLFEYKPEVPDTVERPWPFTSIEIPDTVIVEPVTVEKISPDVVMAFKNVLFKSAQSVLSPVSYAELDILAAYLKVDPSLHIEIYGHTDNAGEEKRNLELSANRAKAVADYLIAKGIGSANVTYTGFGSSKPIAPNDSEEGRSQNRRVEFIIKKVG